MGNVASRVDAQSGDVTIAVFGRFGDVHAQAIGRFLQARPCRARS